MNLCKLVMIFALLFLISACKREPIEGGVVAEASIATGYALFKSAEGKHCNFDTDDGELVLGCEPELVSDMIGRWVFVEYKIEQDNAELQILRSYEGDSVPSMWVMLQSADKGVGIFETESSEELSMSGDVALIQSIADYSDGWIVIDYVVGGETNKIIGYNAEFAGYYEPSASKKNICTFRASDGDAHINFACDDATQEDIASADTDSFVSISYRYSDHGNSAVIEMLDYSFTHNEDEELETSPALDEQPQMSYGIFDNAIFDKYNNGYCYFILQDEYYNVLELGCSEEDVYSFDSRHFYHLGYTGYELTHHEQDDLLPAMQMYFKGQDGDVCNFVRDDGYEESMYCNGRELYYAADDLLTVYYMPNVVDDYPLLVEIKVN